MEAFERMRASLTSTAVYFDFDKALIRPDQVRAIADNANLASIYSNDYVTLQGNCDERGSREYNLALGQRRADTVKARMVLLGVPDSRIETVSFGREKPRELCHDETCWQVNRRADFVHAWKEASPH
jgi:peptidoglycan-associated lipoprotein